MAKVLVIGSGMGGMACAARLASKGHRVTVVEQSDTWGGKLGLVRHGEHVFDTGPSLFTLPAVYRDLFLKTGAPLEDSIEIVDLETAFRYQFSDGTVLKMPGVGIGKCADAIGDCLGGDSADQWRSFMKRAADIWAVTRKPFLESELNGMKSLLSMAWRVNDIKTIAPFATLREITEKYISDPRLITLVDRYATYTGSDPRIAPAALATVPYIEQMFGAYHISGGVRELGRALFERCEKLGIEFRFNTSIENISATSRVHGATSSNGEFFAADIVVANADAANVYEHLLPKSSATKSARNSLAKSTPSLSGFVLLFALSGTTPGLEHHNVYFPADYENEFDSVFGFAGPKRPVQDPTVYICAPKDSKMSPTGTESWFTLINAPRHEPDSGVDWNDSTLISSYRNHVIGTLGSRGLNFEERISWEQVITPADLETRTYAPGGSIYGTSSNGVRSAFLRPQNVTAIENLYLVGGSSHPGGGLPLVGMSAEIVANHIGRAS